MKRLGQVLPIFPLPNVVFFPGTVLPLHIFEPRYRAMAADALAGERRIGMVLLRPGWESHYEGCPEPYEIGSVGHIEHSEQLPDGRYNILLNGQQKFRICRFVQDKPYRRAEVEILPEALSGAERAGARQRKLSLVQQYKSLLQGLTRSDVSSLDELLSLSLARVINMVAFSLPVSLHEKQALLELGRVVERYDAVVEIIRKQIDDLALFNTFRPLSPSDPSVN